LAPIHPPLVAFSGPSVWVQILKPLVEQTKGALPYQVAKEPMCDMIGIWDPASHRFVKTIWNEEFGRKFDSSRFFNQAQPPGR
jgi:hypothetical protein